MIPLEILPKSREESHMNRTRPTIHPQTILRTAPNKRERAAKRKIQTKAPPKEVANAQAFQNQATKPVPPELTETAPRE